MKMQLQLLVLLIALLDTMTLLLTVKGASAGESSSPAVQSVRSADALHGTTVSGGGSDDVLLSPAGSLLTAPISGATVNHPTTAAPPSVNASSQPMITTTTSSQHKNGNNCYFPSEYQGVYQVQSSLDSYGRVVYDQVEIGPQDISVWGTCHALFGQHVLTHTSTENGECFRCFHVQMRTASILQVNTEGLEKCYTKEEVARSKCPVPASIRPGDGIFLWRKSGSIDGAAQSPAGHNIYRSLCPLDGEFTFTYYLNGSPLCETGNTLPSNLASPNSPTEHVITARNVPSYNEPNDLEQPLSTISNCPSRDILHATFRSCSFTDRETTFKCLGTWPGENGQTFIGLMDFYDDSYAKYRCALYKEEKSQTFVKGVLMSHSTFFVSLSPDSTCSTELHNATYGFETLQLSPVSRFDKDKAKARIRSMKRKLTTENMVSAGGEDTDANGKPLGRMPFAGGLNRSSKRTHSAADSIDSSYENVTCQFPDWMQGDWQYFSVKTDDMYTKDLPADFMLFDGFPMANQQQLCVGRDVISPGQDEKILMYSQTSCGEEYVSCMWVRRKSSAMMEFRRGISVPVNDINLLKRNSEAPSLFPPLHICEDSFFHEAPWITQINLDVKESVLTKNGTCPFFGELEAQLGRGEKCAAFSSHCGSPDVFEYKIRSCKSMKHRSYKAKQAITYDERHYRCVSSWTDKGNTIFMTERMREEEVEQFAQIDSSGPRFRVPRNGSSGVTVETQCFVMKVQPNDGTFVIASLSSDCRNMMLEDRSWDNYLAQNGLKFRQTANCSTMWPTETQNDTSPNELPSSGWHRHRTRLQTTGHTNDTDENFNTISFAEITSGGPTRTFHGSSSSCVVFFICFLLFAVQERRINS